MDELVRAYYGIFDLDSDKCEVKFVKMVGWTKNESNASVYKFIYIIEAPSDFGTVVPSSNEMTALRNRVMRHNRDLGGVDVVLEVKWKVDKDGKSKKKRFDFMCSLSTQSVFEFQVIDGTYTIMAEGFGIFY